MLRKDVMNTMTTSMVFGKIGPTYMSLQAPEKAMYPK